MKLLTLIISACVMMVGCGEPIENKESESPKIDTALMSFKKEMHYRDSMMDLEFHYANQALNYWDSSMTEHAHGNNKKAKKYWNVFLKYKDSIDKFHF